MFTKILVWLGLKKIEVENKIEEVKAEATKTLDVNKDGKVNVEDVKAAVAEVKAEVKEKVARKPRAPKTAAPVPAPKGKRKSK